MSTDIHNKVFDDGTLIKLEILREYLKKWLPVFFAGKPTGWNKVFIYDFFAGEGSDFLGNYGSPRIILEELKEYCQEIVAKNIDVKVVFNEYKKVKAHKLQLQCENQLGDCRIKCPIYEKKKDCVFTLIIENKDFIDFFEEIYPTMQTLRGMPRFMFLDQYGIKYITEDILHKISKLKTTDFIFFISSSFARRFIENEEFQKYLKLTRQDFDENKPYHCHRVIYNYYKSLLKPEDNLCLAPFSIKKNHNVYGLIFGTHHTLGMEKFLSIAWKINKNTGDANFDIDDEKINPSQPSIFPEFNIPSKIQFFEQDLRNKIDTQELKNNLDIYIYSLETGFLPKHANKVIAELKNEGKIPKDFKTVSQNIHRLTNPSYI